MVNGDRAVSLKVTDDLGAWHSVRYLFSVRGPGQASLSSTHTEAVFGTVVRLQVDVPPAAGGSAPTGNVEFRVGTTLLATLALRTGNPSTVSLLTSLLPPGTHVLRATYLGDPNYQSALSNPLTLIVTPQTAGGLREWGRVGASGTVGGLRAARAARGRQHRVRCPRRRRRTVGPVRHTRRSQPLGMGRQFVRPDRRRHDDLPGVSGSGPEHRPVAVHRRGRDLGWRDARAGAEVRRQRLGMGHQRVWTAGRRHDHAARTSGQGDDGERAADERRGDRRRRHGGNGAPSRRDGVDLG